LAPLALIAVLIVFLAIVSSSGDGGSSSTTTEESSTTTSTHTSKKTTKTSSKKTTKKTAASDNAKTYTVQVGDTLGGIADKTGVPLSRIEQLNPDVDPHAMVTGQEIRLK
jgi:LysM repeat protein